jgi:hypothetical protein
LAPRREALWERVQKATHISENEKRNATGYEPYTPTGDPADDLYQSATLLPLGFDAGDSGAEDDTGKERFTEELKQAGVTSSTIIAELVARAFPSNGEWRDDA